jgi:hypothetical protein
MLLQACQQRGVAQKTIAHYVSDLRKLFDFLISEGTGTDNPRTKPISSSCSMPSCAIGKQKRRMHRSKSSYARCKPMKRFPFLITFTIDEAAHAVNILRVFNTYQEPLH